jgi:hypothetical protein
MRRNLLLVGLALSLGLALGGCESFDKIGDMDSWFNAKKPLPGDRKAVFPDGVPGVEQGVPPELVRGYQPPAEPPPQPAAVVAEKPKPKPRPRPKKVAVPAKPPAAITVQPTARPAQTARRPAAAPPSSDPAPPAWPQPNATPRQPAAGQPASPFPPPPPPPR